MALKMQNNFGKRDFNNMVKEAEKIYHDNIIRTLRKIGEEAVNEARASGNYDDHTANLRNSIGYMITYNGVQVGAMHFPNDAQQKIKAPKRGRAEGMDLARKVAQEFPNGFALIVVAGMNYSAYVESKGRVVLVSAEQLVNQKMQTLL